MSPPGIGRSRDELVGLVRSFLGDRPEENRLIPDYEVSDDKIKLALEMTLDQYNNTPPFERVTFERLPSLTLIIHGTAIQCLVMAGIVQSRNTLNFTDGGIPQVVAGKSQEYQSWIANLLGAYREEMLSIKTSLNMERNFGVVGSPYGGVFDYDDL
jgi:hypothetical protein